MGWTVEIKLPWKTIQEHFDRKYIPPKPGQLMRVNFSRVQWHHDYSQLVCAKQTDVSCEDWAWSSTNNGSLHVTDMWGKVYFSDLPAGTVKDHELKWLAGQRPLSLPSPTRLEPDMVYIPPCRVTLGPDPSDPDVSPEHTAELEGYWIDRYPVTVAQYAEFLNETRQQPGELEFYHEFMANPDHCAITRDASGFYRVSPGRERHPIVYITHATATAYAEWAGKKLPTEAQWERAARGLHGRTYPWGDEPIDASRANYDFHYGGTAEVGSFPTGATDEGVFDLCGNVNEWCRDLYDAYPGGVAVLDASTGEPIEYTSRPESLRDAQRSPPVVPTPRDRSAPGPRAGRRRAHSANRARS